MMLRRRPHPARRVRRWLGATCVGLYLTLAIVVGVHERRPPETSDLQAGGPEPVERRTPTTQGLGVDLDAATFAPPPTVDPEAVPAPSIDVPRPAPAPRESGYATTTAPPATTPPTTAPPATTPPSTTAPPATTTAPPATTTLAPTTTIYIAGS